jgi:integrase
MALTEMQIRHLQPAEKAYRCSDGRGLYLEIHPAGSKLWRFKYRFAGKQKRLALGRYPDVGLAGARRKLDEARRLLEAGEDPLALRKQKKLIASFHAANTFEDIAKEFIERMVAEERAEATIVKANWLLSRLKPIAKRPVADIKPLEIMAVLKGIEAQGKRETAHRCRSFASRIFRYAVATGRGESDPTFILRGALIAPKVKHHAALLEPAQVGQLLRDIDKYSGNALTRLAMQIAPHVMTRPGELRKADWSEFNLEQAVWTVPAERMKMRLPHRVPLSRQVIGYLRELQSLTGATGNVFPAFHTSRRTMSENTVNNAFRRMGYGANEVTAHGLRTTASTLLNESGRWSPDAIERSLAHMDTNAIRGIYNRGLYWGERTAMHQWWSDYLDQLREGIEVAPLTGHAYGLRRA